MAVGMWRRWRSARGADGGGVADCDAGTINVRTDIVILLFLVINNNRDGSSPAHVPGMRCWPAPCMHSRLQNVAALLTFPHLMVECWAARPAVGAVHRHLNGHRPGTASSAAAGTAGPPSGAHARMRVRACVRAWFLPQALRSVGVLPAVVICFRVLLTSHFLPLLPATLRIGLLAMRLLLLQRMNWKCRSSSRSASR